MRLPDLTLPDQTGRPVAVSEIASRMVMFFYPAASTPGCTQEACDFRDDHQRFLDAGYLVVGVSPDPPEANLRFKQEHEFPFDLLSDEDHRLAEAVGAWGLKKNYGKEYVGLIRTTLVVEDGEVVGEYRNIKAAGHVERLMSELL